MVNVGPLHVQFGVCLEQYTGRHARTANGRGHGLPATSPAGGLCSKSRVRR